MANPIIYPVPPYHQFTQWTPTIPAFYQNVYSPEEVIKKILWELSKMETYIDNLAEVYNTNPQFAQVIDKLQDFQTRLYALQDELTALLANGKSRNPVNGLYEPVYTVAKLMYDALRWRAMTSAEIKATGKTWAQLASSGYTYMDIELFANDYFGNGERRAKYTDPANVDAETPGFVPKEG